MTALIIAVIAVLAIAAVLTVARRARSSETERFHQARALTTGWAQQGEQAPVFDYVDGPEPDDRVSSVELVEVSGQN